jgi:hypothetical protein
LGFIATWPPPNPSTPARRAATPREPVPPTPPAFPKRRPGAGADEGFAPAGRRREKEVLNVAIDIIDDGVEFFSPHLVFCFVFFAKTHSFNDGP